MRKVALFGVWFVSAFISVASLGVNLAQADDLAVGVGQNVTISGVAHFEKRYTLVPNELGAGANQFPQSKPYWAIVLQSEGTQYEIDQVFNEGDARSPQTVNLAGKLIREGSQVKVDAVVEYSATNYCILGDVRGVTLVLWYGTGDGNSVSYSNWNCQGDLDRETQIRIAVWSDGMPVDLNDASPFHHYGMRLSAIQESSQGPKSFQLVTIGDAVAYVDRDTVVYEGGDASSKVELQVPGGSVNPTSDHLEATLRFNLARIPDGVSRIPMQSQTTVSCSRVR